MDEITQLQEKVEELEKTIKGIYPVCNDPRDIELTEDDLKTLSKLGRERKATYDRLNLLKRQDFERQNNLRRMERTAKENRRILGLD
jgi:hypothetical protein